MFSPLQLRENKMAEIFLQLNWSESFEDLFTTIRDGEHA